jgi:hypothetical protein
MKALKMKPVIALERLGGVGEENDFVTSVGESGPTPSTAE